MTTNPNEPINPCTIKSMKTTTVRPGWEHSEPEPVFMQGLSKREYFAAMAMQGLLASVTLSPIPVSTRITMAVEAADALINELNK